MTRRLELISGNTIEFEGTRWQEQAASEALQEQGRPSCSGCLGSLEYARQLPSLLSECKDPDQFALVATQAPRLFLLNIFARKLQPQ